MKRLSLAYAAGVLLLLTTGCHKLSFDGEKKHDDKEEKDDKLCPSFVKDLKDEDFKDWGKIRISHEKEKLLLNLLCDHEDVFLSKVKVVYGSKDHVEKCLDDHGWLVCDGPKKFDIKKDFDGKTRKETIKLDNCFKRDKCIWVAVFVELKKKDGKRLCCFGYGDDGEKDGDKRFKFVFKICLDKCKRGEHDDDKDKDKKCEILKTITPGGWGSKPNGNNPGKYLHDHFKKVFPDGLLVGCKTKHHVKLTKADAVTKLLPCGGEASILKKIFVDPHEIKNVLVGHLIALKLNVEFDKHDKDFGKGHNELCKMVIVHGKFKGWTVEKFLEVAEKVLGECDWKFKVKDILECAEKINENFSDGKHDKGFLKCEKDDDH